MPEDGAPGGLLKIGEFSQLGQVSVRTLRHYDDLGLLKPARLDRFTDYRYYAVGQLPRLNRILALKDLGFSLDEVARLVEDDLPPAELRGMLRRRRGEIEREVRAEQARLGRVEARLRQIESEGRASPYEVLLKATPALTVASARQVIPTADGIGERCAAMYHALYGALERGGVRHRPPEVTLYHNREYTERDIDMEAATGVDPAPLPAPLPARSRPAPGGFAVRTLPAAPEVASTVHRGRFRDVDGAIVALITWIAGNGYSVDGPMREVHLVGATHAPGDAHAEDVVVEMQVPVTPAGASPAGPS